MQNKNISHYHASVSNKIIHAAYDLTILEKRLIYLTLGRINSKEKLSSLELYTCSPRDYADLLNIEVFNATTALKTACNKLYERRIFIKEGNKTIKTRWVQSVIYDDDTNEVQLRWSEDVIPYISDLKTRFTRLLLGNSFKLDSIYAARLYELCIESNFKSMELKNIILDVEDIYNLWSVPEYARDFREFKRNILIPAVKELKKKGLIEIEEKGIVYKRVNRKIRYITIYYRVL